MNPKTRNYVMWAVVITMFLVMMTMTQNSMTNTSTNELSYTEFTQSAEAGTLRDVKIDPQTGVVTGMLEDGKASKHACEFPSVYFAACFIRGYRDFLHALYAGRWSRRRDEFW